MAARIESRFVDVDRMRLHARVTAVDPRQPMPVVFVHGIGVASPYFVPTLGRLASDYRCYALDLPGLGESDKPERTFDVPELADAAAAWAAAARLERPAWVGNSLGCQVAVELAVRRPELVARLVLLGPTTDPGARSPLRQTLRWLRNSVHERPSQLPLLIRDYRAAGVRLPYETFRLALRDGIEEKLPHVQAPTLIVRGERDPIVPRRWAEEATRLLPRGRLATVAGAGHTLNFNSPDEVARLLRPFLAGGR